MSLSYVLQIQGDETHVGSYQSKDNQQYGYIVMHGEALRFRPIVSFSPVYASSAEAVAAGTAFVKDICAIDFSKERNKLVDLLGAPEVVGTIDAIVKASKQ